MKMRTPKPMQEASFDLTPMIDVVLLLIIFFMFTTHFAKTQYAPMDLPRERGEATAEKPERPAEFVVELNRQGDMRVLGKPATADDIKSLLRADLAKVSQKTAVIVRADRNCPALHLNRLVSVLVQLGVRDWKLATASEEGSTGGTP